ncbi:MAG: hypothetical protein IT385_05405 [Deltaproteobacteria bacterium]|nr:hypothetical protein [Deltaproteobacteria bacterium]
MSPYRLVLLVPLVSGAALAACGDDGRECVGASLLPHKSPLNLGNFRPLAQGEAPDPGDPEAVPYEVVLFLRNACAGEVDIASVCVVGDAHNGDEDDPAFTIEGPVPSSLATGEEAAVRITYDPSSVNRDLDDDGARDPDQVAIVVQSNATNYPTLVVPVCAIVIPDGAEVVSFVCESPVTVPAGARDASLCGSP